MSQRTMDNRGTVILYPPVGLSKDYTDAYDIVRREVPALAIEFMTAKGQLVVSTLPYTVIWR